MKTAMATGQIQIFMNWPILLGSSIKHGDMDEVWGRVNQFSIFLHKPYLGKWSTKEEGGQNFQKSVHMVYGRPLNLFNKLTKVINEGGGGQQS